MRRERQRHRRHTFARELHRVDGEDRVVPVVDAAEEDAGPVMRGHARRRHAERRDRDQRLQRRVAPECDRIHASHRQQRAEVEVALRFGGAEEEVALRERIHQRRVIVRVHLGAALREVVEVLDDERIVEVDHRRDRPRVREEIVRHVPLHHRDVALAADAQQRLRRERAGVARQHRHLVPVCAQHALDLEEADADAGRLAMPERFGADQHHPHQPRPLIFSTIECNFHVRDWKIASSVSCSRAISA